MSERSRVAACLLALVCACDVGARAADTEAETGFVAETTGTGASTGDVIYIECPDKTEAQLMMMTHSFLEDGQCWCEPGFTWNNPFNPYDFGCNEVLPRDVACAIGCDPSALVAEACEDEVQSCDCEHGDAWCSTAPMDTRCCFDGAQQQHPSHDPSSESGGTSESDGSTTSAADTTDGTSSSGGTTAPGTSEQ